MNSRISESRQPSWCWWRGNYLGWDVTIEVVQRWYATRKFIFFGQYTSSRLSKFLKKIPFGIPLPPGALVQHIKIETFTYNMHDPDLTDLLLNNTMPVLRLPNKNIRIPYMDCVG
jgi:hypothetical protein